MSAKNREPALATLCGVFLRIGTVGFGGALVTINLMKEALVDRLGWISEREFMERVGMVKLLPGPVSTLMAIALGRKFFGVLGSALALLCFVAPAFLLILIWDLSEDSIAALVAPEIGDSFLWSFRIYIVASILMAAYKLLRDAWRNLPYGQRWKFFIFGTILFYAAISSYFNRWETEILALSLLLGLLFHQFLPASARRDRLHDFGVVAVFLLFFTASVVVFGTGYMLFPYIERHLVESGMITRETFEAGILLGNLSPGPVVIASTYYGWKLAGLLGACAATLGIFGGPFLLMNLIFHALEKLRSRQIVQHLSLCIVPAVVVVLLHFNWELFQQGGAEPLKIIFLAAYLAILYYLPAFGWQLGAVLLFSFLKYRWQVLG